MFIRPLIRFLGYKVRFFFFYIYGKEEILEKLNSTEDPGAAMMHDFTNALIGYIVFVVIGFIGVSVYEFFLNM